MARPVWLLSGWLVVAGAQARCLDGFPPVPCRYPHGYPVAPLNQINLKVPDGVAAHWKAQAAAQGLSVRDWLVAITAPTAGHQAGPAGGAALAERVAQLEAATAELRAALAQLQASPRRATRPPALSIPPAGEGQALNPSPERVSPAPRTGELPAVDGAITTAELAERTGTNRAAWNNWAGPGRVGQVRNHRQAGPWRLVGQAPPPGGGPLRWLWVPAEG